jgi:F0F1-type ATP synthase membrane subunit c/vacuolar-type H+-ATPase subunit K
MLRGWITFIEAAGLIGLVFGGPTMHVPCAILVGTALIAAAIVETRK